MKDELVEDHPVPAGRGVSPVRAVERSIALLRAFSPTRPWQSLTELARAASLDKGTARRLLLTLADCGVVIQDAERRRWALGLAVLQIAAAVPEAQNVVEASRPILAELARATRLMAFLSVVRDEAALCLDRVNGLPELEINWWRVGEHIPLHAGSGPRVLLAHLPDDAFERIVASRVVEARTRYTESDAESVRRSRETIRTRGWELAVNDVVEGISGVGVPVFATDGTLLAALSVSGLTPTVATGGREPACLSHLRTAAARLTAILDVCGPDLWRSAVGTPRPAMEGE